MSPMLPGTNSSLGGAGSDAEGLLIQQLQFGGLGSLGSGRDGSSLLYGSGLLPAGVPASLKEFEEDEDAAMDMP